MCLLEKHLEMAIDSRKCVGLLYTILPMFDFQDLLSIPWTRSLNKEPEDTLSLDHLQK